MTRILLVRHGQTDWNEGPGERFRGRANIPLNAAGVQQAEATAVRLGCWPVKAVYSSPLERAMGVARILARPFGLEARPCEGMVDIDFGEWEGLALEEARAQDPALYSLWLARPHLVTFPGGESLAQVGERAMSCLKAIVADHPDETVAIVSHRVVCKLLLCQVLSLDCSRFRCVEQYPCAISIIETRGQSFTLTLVNDACHLGTPPCHAGAAPHEGADWSS